MGNGATTVVLNYRAKCLVFERVCNDTVPYRSPESGRVYIMASERHL